MSDQESGLRPETIDHYLETVFYIHGEGEVVRPSRIAEWIGVRPPTVSVTLQRLEAAAWIKIADDRSVAMTRKGKTRAERIVRGHRLLERWLTDVLGLDWANADEQAQRLVPGLSDEVADALDSHLEMPATCPHGNVIPGRPTPYGTLVALGSLSPGQGAVVQRISEVAEHDAPDLLRHLEEAGIVPGAPVILPQEEVDLGALALDVGSKRTAISREAAGFVWVEPLS